MAKEKSRPARWQEAVNAIGSAMDQVQSAIEDLRNVQSEYQDWLDNLPENLQSSPVGDKLQAIVDIDLDSATSELENLISEAENVDFPQGFGRD